MQEEAIGVILNPQGIALESALDKTNLACLNNGSMTRFASQEGHTDSVIDMALISVSAYDDCTWETLQEHGSDHVPCLSMVRRERNWVRKKVMRAFTYPMDEDDKDVVSRLRRKALPVKRSGVEEREKTPW